MSANDQAAAGVTSGAVAESAAQPALFRGPGTWSALQVWRAHAAGVDLRTLADELLDDTSAAALVAIAASADLHFLPLEAQGHRIPSTQASVLVQVSAESREELVAQLRRTTVLCAPLCYLDEELHGGRLGIGREPFGFRDGLRVPTHEQIQTLAVIGQGPERGGSYLLYLRFEQSLERFARLQPREQARVIGLDREGQRIASPPNDAHVPRARRHGAFIRRGFPYRSRDTEGLAFVAACRAPARFRAALEAMLGLDGGEPERLLRYAVAVSGGLYFAPPITSRR